VSVFFTHTAVRLAPHSDDILSETVTKFGIVSKDVFILILTLRKNYKYYYAVLV